MKLDLCIQLVLSSQSRKRSATTNEYVPLVERRKSVVLERQSTSSSISSFTDKWCCS